MRLLLCRHAHAVDPSETADDRVRWLTAHGRETARKVGAMLAHAGDTPSRVLTSPLVRAVQTAELIVAATGFGGPVEVEPSLAPDGRLSSLIERLTECGESATVLCVGHEPQMSAWTAELVGHASPRLAFEPACIACIEWDGLPERGAGRLAWFQRSRTLDRLRLDQP